MFTIDHDDDVGDLDPGGAERSGGFEDGGAAGDEIFDDEADLAGGEGAFDGFGSAVVFDFFAAHEHGDFGGGGDAGGDGEGGVGDAAEKVEGGGGREGGD